METLLLLSFWIFTLGFDYHDYNKFGNFNYNYLCSAMQVKLFHIFLIIIIQNLLNHKT